MKKILFNISIMLLFAFVFGCATKKVIDDMDDEELYKTGYEIYKDGGYTEAIRRFNTLERLYPYSPLNKQAILLSGDAAYHKGLYNDAITYYNQYVKLNPNDEKVVYALYQRAMSYYKQVGDSYHDQKFTQQALSGFQELLTRFPLSSQARKSKILIEFLIDKLAGKELSIGRYYQFQNRCVPALNRYKIVVKKYSTSQYIPEILFRMIECQLYLGLDEQANKTASVLGYNYKSNVWYKRAYSTINKKHDKLKPQSWWNSSS